MKFLCVALLILTTLVLALYPFVLMGNIMAVAAIQPDPPLPFFPTLSSRIFLWGSTLYPLVWLAGLVASILCFRKNLPAAVFWQAGVIGYLALIIAAMAGWLLLG